MSGENFNRKRKNTKVLLAPLDWGLGHATRCIPIIKELIANGLDVTVAANGATANLLKIEFPQMRFLLLAGYGISYSKSKKWLTWKILSQLPRILSTMHHEHQWLKKAVEENECDLIISDNHPGFYHATVKSVYITHQLNIHTSSNFGS